MRDPVHPTEPGAIERESFRIISDELGPEALVAFSPEEQVVVKRVIHTTADFEFARNLVFNRGAIRSGLAALRAGSAIVVDTRMTQAGVNAKALERLRCDLRCYASLPEVAQEARSRGVTRALVAMEHAARDPSNRIFAVGNSPTALLTLCDLIHDMAIAPALVVAVPVGFVNVVESKERVLGLPVPSIVARGRKGGSTVTVAILNALLCITMGREQR